MGKTNDQVYNSEKKRKSPIPLVFYKTKGQHSSTIEQ